MPLKLENASKRIGRNWVFRDVSFEVSDGEIFGICGPNGSGKSELLGSLPAEGVGVDRPSFFARLLSSSAVSPLDRLSQIEKYIEKGGPIVLGEPFRGLDIDRKRKLAEDMRSAAGRNSAVVFSTVDFAELSMVCDRGGILANGYIQQIGTPRELYHTPVNRIVASFTGRNNLIQARRLTSSRSDAPEFQTIEGGHRLFTQKTELRGLGAINKDATLSIRPEQIVLSFGASFPEDNLLRAVISGVHFHGATTAVTLDCSGMELEATVTRLIGLNIGDECMVGLPPDRIRVLPD